jgi:pilus assembly protein Flp/PilA
MKKLIRLVEDEGGATALEYGLLVAAIAAVLIVVAYFAGSRVGNTFNSVSQHIS